MEFVHLLYNDDVLVTKFNINKQNFLFRKHFIFTQNDINLKT